jgi:hypothetical protein
MADATVVHIGENSPEQVAYRLFRDIAILEKKASSHHSELKDCDRQWVLDTFADCMNAVKWPESLVDADESPKE